MSHPIQALDRNDLAALESMLKQGVSTDLADKAGRTALMYAALDGKLPFMRLLLEHHADVNAQDKSGYTALHFAAQDYRPEAVELLCRSGAYVDQPDQFGNTPLWRALVNSRERGEVIRILLLYGAQVEKKNSNGKSPRHIAETVANYDLKQFLPPPAQE